MVELGPGPSNSIRLVPISRLAAGGRWRVEAMRSLNEPCFLWFTKGQGRITVQGQTRSYTPNNGIFIPPGVMHGFEAGPGIFGTAVFFGKDESFPLPDAPLHLRIREVQSHHELNSLLDSIQRELSGETTEHEQAARLYLGLLGIWIRRQGQRQDPALQDQDSSQKLVARYTELLEKEFRSGMGVADFAAALGVTPSHLTRCCQTTCGKPALALLQERRLFEARRMLVDTQTPVNNIASSLGFASPAYFARAFHSLTGKSPTAFRRAP